MPVISLNNFNSKKILFKKEEIYEEPIREPIREPIQQIRESKGGKLPNPIPPTPWKARFTNKRNDRNNIKFIF